MEIFKLILNLFLGFAKGLAWGLVFFIAAIILLPENILFKLLKKFKPDIAFKSKILSKVRMFCDYMFCNKEIALETRSSDSKEFQINLSELLKEKKLTESNLFFLDLLKNFSNMIFFSASQLGNDERRIAELLNGSMEYLIYYSNQLKSINTSQNIQERVNLKAESLQNQLADLINFLDKEYGEQQIKIAQFSLKQGIGSFNNFMKSEYDSAYENLNNINKLLAENFINYLDK